MKGAALKETPRGVMRRTEGRRGGSGASLQRNFPEARGESAQKLILGAPSSAGPSPELPSSRQPPAEPRRLPVAWAMLQWFKESCLL